MWTNTSNTSIKLVLNCVIILNFSYLPKGIYYKPLFCKQWFTEENGRAVILKCQTHFSLRCWKCWRPELLAYYEEAQAPHCEFLSLVLRSPVLPVWKYTPLMISIAYLCPCHHLQFLKIKFPWVLITPVLVSALSC